MRAILGLFAALRRRLGVIFVFFVLFLAAAMVAVYVKRPSYESAAKVLINFEGRGVSLSRSDVQYNTTTLQAVEAVTSQAEIMRSRDLAQQVVEQLGPDAFRDPPSGGPLKPLFEAIEQVEKAVKGGLVEARLIEPTDPRDELVEAVENGIQAVPVRQAQVIAIAFRWRNPRVPPLVLNKLIELYQAKVAQLNGQTDGYDLYVQQANRAREELDKAERGMTEFQKRFKVVDLKREKDFLQERVEKLAPVVEATGAAGAAAPAGALAGPQDQDSAAVGGQIPQLRTQLNALRTNRAKLLTTFTAGAREVKEIDLQIDAVEGQISKETKTVSGALSGYRSRLATLQGAETEFNRLTRNVGVANDAYETYRKASEDRRMMKAQEIKVRIQIIDQPNEPVGAIGPSRLMLAIAALIAAFALALAAGLLIDWAARERRQVALDPA